VFALELWQVRSFRTLLEYSMSSRGALPYATSEAMGDLITSSSVIRPFHANTDAIGKDVDM
jgi:hypothetical protein